MNTNNLTVDIIAELTKPELMKTLVRKEEQKVKYYTDVLALSAAWHRLRSEGKYGLVSSLADPELVKYTTELDHCNAAKIRKYYINKLMILNLKGEHISSFRKDLSEFLSSDGLFLAEKCEGMVYRLPDFYEYDTKLDSYREHTFNDINKPVGSNLIGEFLLEPSTKLVRKANSSNLAQYWLCFDDTGHPACITLTANNPLIHIWDKIFESNKLLNIKGSFRVSSEVGFKYYKALKWELLVKE